MTGNELITITIEDGGYWRTETIIENVRED